LLLTDGVLFSGNEVALVEKPPSTLFLEVGDEVADALFGQVELTGGLPLELLLTLLEIGSIHKQQVLPHLALVVELDHGVVQQGRLVQVEVLLQ